MRCGFNSPLFVAEEIRSTTSTFVPARDAGVSRFDPSHQPKFLQSLQFMTHNATRLLALDPSTKGFGYVIFEPPFHLVAWGFARVEGDKQAGAIARFKKLLAQYRPDLVVLEDALAPGSRRRPRVRLLIDSLMKLCRDQNIAISTIARSAIVTRFASPEERVPSKQSIALDLAKYFPELQSQLPPQRKLWQGQYERTAIFDALALAVTYAAR